MNQEAHRQVGSDVAQWIKKKTKQKKTLFTVKEESCVLAHRTLNAERAVHFVFPQTFPFRVLWKGVTEKFRKMKPDRDNVLTSEININRTVWLLNPKNA